MEAQVVLPCEDLDQTLEFFTRKLGFRLEMIFPADDPTTAVISGHGVRLRLQRRPGGSPGVLRLACADPGSVAGGARELTAPNGTRIELVEAEPDLKIPPARASFVLTRMSGSGGWGVGRAGMLYRDLIPDRMGGRFIASHIRIPDGGPVPDYVHYHKVRFQLIFCAKGWVRVVYEDQGPAFILREGDCVLQPPQIRHRVLESSPGLEVVEISCPAEHETFAESILTLPTSTVRPDREFGGQRFVRHDGASARWGSWRLEGFESRDFGIGPATRGLGEARVVRAAKGGKGRTVRHDAELVFWFMLRGALTLDVEGHGASILGTADSLGLPAGLPHSISNCSQDVEWLEVTLPADIKTR